MNHYDGIVMGLRPQVHVLDAGHFALDTAADQIAYLVRGFIK